MSSKILAKTEKIGILQQSKTSNHWTAPAAASAAFYTLHWVNAGVINPNPDVQVEQINSLSQYGTHREWERFFIDESSGLPTLPISGICDKNEMAPILVSAFQGCTEAAGTPFNKVIADAGLSGPIDWAGNSGYLFTVALNQGASADDGIILENGIVDTLNIVWDMNARGTARMVNFNGTMKFNDIKYEQTISGGSPWTNSTITQNFFNKTDAWAFSYGALGLVIDSVDYAAQVIRRVEFQLNNNITSNARTTGGKAAQYDWSPERKMIITLDYNSVTEKILKDFQDGASVTECWWGNDSAAAKTDGKWNIGTGYGKIMTPPKQYNGEFIGLQLEIAFFSASATTTTSINYCDTIDWGF